MRNYLAAFAALLLIAAAFFLPGEIAAWNDTALLDEPHILRQEEARESFAERTQLTVAEKLMLLRGGQLSKVPLEEAYYTDDGEMMEFRYAITGGVVEFYAQSYLGRNTSVLDPGEAIAFSAAAAGTNQNLESLDSEAQASAQEWTDRLERVQSELRLLQAAGALPSLWDNQEKEFVEVTDRTQSVYVDRETQVSFQTYSLTLSLFPYMLSVTVDAQSGKVLGFILRWTNRFQPSWGYRGAAYFGTAWRDYWGMDSVNPVWDNRNNLQILESSEDALHMNGEYNANSQIGFTYNDQTVNIPLTSWTTTNRGCAIGWNP